MCCATRNRWNWMRKWRWAPESPFLGSRHLTGWPRRGGRLLAMRPKAAFSATRVPTDTACIITGNPAPARVQAIDERQGKCCDSATAEIFFKTIKTEFPWQWSHGTHDGLADCPLIILFQYQGSGQTCCDFTLCRPAWLQELGEVAAQVLLRDLETAPSCARLPGPGLIAVSMAGPHGHRLTTRRCRQPALPAEFAPSGGTLLAGVSGLLHGVRNAGATRLANAGAKEWEIASFLAHADTSQASVYTKRPIERVWLTVDLPGHLPKKCSTSRGCWTEGRKCRRLTAACGEKWQPVGESNPSFQVENLAS